MIKIYYRNLRDKKIQTLDSYRVGSWTHVEEPTEEELQKLTETYGLDLSLLHDAIDQYEVPRMEEEDGIVYIFSRFPFNKNNQITTSPILFIIENENFITITKDKFPLLDGFMKQHVFYTTQKTKLFLQLFALINASFNTYLHTISRETRSSSYQLEKINNKDIALFVGYERVLNDFHLALVRTNAVLNNLLSHNFIRLFEDDRDLIEDIFLNNDQLIQLSKENLRSIVNIRDAYSTIMTNNTNRVIRFFTSITVILTIPTIIASIYGMNVALPYQNSPMAFIIVMTMIIVISVGLIIMFLKNDWL
ncbi:MAG: magnesium transporter CorA family protein [Candidatus Roizmanbacteria bacterium]|nr:magnesium transporter CorA family protein [Candidatus Roizmanbacteria bacterium]